jgi:hypothetical protein
VKFCILSIIVLETLPFVCWHSAMLNNLLFLRFVYVHNTIGVHLDLVYSVCCQEFIVVCVGGSKTGCCEHLVGMLRNFVV